MTSYYAGNLCETHVLQKLEIDPTKIQKPATRVENFKGQVIRYMLRHSIESKE